MPPRPPPRLAVTAAMAVLLVAGIAGLAVAVAGRSEQAASATGALPGLQTGPAPWGADTADWPPACVPSACPR